VLRLLARILSSSGRQARRGRRAVVAGTGVAALGLAVLGAAPPAAAATRTALPPPASTLQQVANFGPNPTGLQMYLYVPDHVRPHPAVVVALHYCTGSGPAFFAATEFASLADRYSFIVVYPSATRAGHCFDVSSPGALVHDGDSDPAGIVSMVRYVERDLHADRSRVFATGLSSGAMMTNVLLGDYPDVFRAGSAMSGVPFGCFATTDGSLWNSACADGDVIKTPREWGDLVRAAYPGYHGPRPRMQLWHGTADTTLYYPNFGEEIKQWTDVLHARLASTSHPQPAWTHTVYVNRAGQAEVDAYSVAGETHNLGFDDPEWAQFAVQFFGLAGRSS
jgi:poly(hydroxyalkanoate) depolymerase family esterase